MKLIDGNKNLTSGDVVTWCDPDNGECSRTLTIKSIEYCGDHLIIIDTNGGELHCYPDELE